MTSVMQVVSRMDELSEPGQPWEKVDSDQVVLVQRQRECPTPVLKETGDWAGDETYVQRVAVAVMKHKTVVNRRSTVFLLAYPAPWIGQHSLEIPPWLALAILEDPALGLDMKRMNEMKDARRADQDLQVPRN